MGPSAPGQERLVNVKTPQDRLYFLGSVDGGWEKLVLVPQPPVPAHGHGTRAHAAQAASESAPAASEKKPKKWDVGRLSAAKKPVVLKELTESMRESQRDNRQKSSPGDILDFRLNSTWNSTGLPGGAFEFSR